MQLVQSQLVLQVFEKVTGAQTYIKVVVLIFLFGVLAFTLSYVGLFLARMEFDRYRS
jgi:hypothetical protein